MSTIDCFLLERTDRYVFYLRRFMWGENTGCKPGLYHNASNLIEIVQPKEQPATGDNHPHDDPQWPIKCQHCGYVFQDGDQWQACYESIWKAEDGREFTLKWPWEDDKDVGVLAAPPGAIWRAEWYEDAKGFGGDDGKVYVVRTPGGDWIIDSPPTGGGRWVRTGTPPKFTVRPSILIGQSKDGQWQYHGFLTNGQLVSC